jgi:putative peptidoglycan lipid II flippase
LQGGGTLVRAGRATALLTGALTIGQLATVVRDLFVAAQVGLSANLDALLLAAAVPMALAGIAAAGPQTALIATLGEVSQRSGDPRQAARLGGSVLVYATLASATLTGFLVLIAPGLLSVLGAGLEPQTRASAVGYLRLLALWVAFGTIAAIQSAILQAAGRFRAMAGAWIAGPVASMLLTLVLWPTMGLSAYAVGLTAGAGATALVLVILSFLEGEFPPLSLSIDRSEWSRLLRHALPLSAGVSLLQLNPLVQRIVASFLAPGAISALRYADLIIRAPLYAAGPAWNAVAYPTLAQAASRPDEDLGSTAEAALRYALAVFVPLVLGTAALAPLLVDVAYARGAFTASDARVTSFVVIGLSPLLLVQAIQPILLGAHNARRHGTLMGLVAAGGVVLNAVLCVALGFTFGVVGVALASSLSALSTLLVLSTTVDEPHFSGRRIAGALAVFAVAATVIAIPAAIAAWLLHAQLPWTADLGLAIVLAIAAVIAYVLVAVRLRIDEVRQLLQLVRRWPLRLGTGRG